VSKTALVPKQLPNVDRPCKRLNQLSFYHLIATCRAKDFANNPLADLKKIAKTADGKFFAAPPELIPAAAGQMVPEIKLETLRSGWLELRSFCQGNVTLMTICFSGYAEVSLSLAFSLIKWMMQPHADSFRAPFIKEFIGKEAGVKLLDIRPILTRLKWYLFSGLVKRTAAEMISENLKDSLLVPYNPAALLEGLGIPNRYGAFCYLVDAEARVRWKASGQATDFELHDLRRFTQALLQERNKD
jgi:hypothetical protein